MSWIAAAAVVLVVAGIVAFAWWRDRAVSDLILKKAVHDFKQAFPDRCMVCSFQQWGFHHGHTERPVADPHDCIEAKQ